MDKDYRFDYAMLYRLKTDCDYYLGNGYAFEGHLWAKTVEEHIEEMKKLYAIVPKKPEWLTAEMIQNYAVKMMEVKIILKMEVFL